MKTREVPHACMVSKQPLPSVRARRHRRPKLVPAASTFQRHCSQADPAQGSRAPDPSCPPACVQGAPGSHKAGGDLAPTAGNGWLDGYRTGMWRLFEEMPSTFRYQECGMWDALLLPLFTATSSDHTQCPNMGRTVTIMLAGTHATGV